MLPAFGSTRGYEWGSGRCGNDLIPRNCNLPQFYLPPNIDHNHSGRPQTWDSELPQSSVPTSSALTAGRQHQTCGNSVVRVRREFLWCLWFGDEIEEHLDHWEDSLSWRDGQYWHSSCRTSVTVLFYGIMSSLLLDVVMKRVFITTPYCALYGFIRPESFHCRKTLDRKRIIYTNVFSCSDNTLIFLAIMSAGHSPRVSKMNTWDCLFWYSTPSSRISSAMILKATIILEKMTCRISLRSSRWKPSAYMSRICFRIVDLPDSPAPRNKCINYQTPVAIGASGSAYLEARSWPALLAIFYLSGSFSQCHCVSSFLRSWYG